MAITKLMHINLSTDGNSHLSNSIDYILKDEKTADGYYVGALNCSAKSACQEMLETKKDFGKEDGRQAYHFCISFKAGDVDESTAFDIIRSFCMEYLGNQYETVFSLHIDKNHLHGHVIFNSVSFVDGMKYHYNDGDWEKIIQPLVDKLCEERGVPALDYHIDEYIDSEGNLHEKRTYSKKYNWNQIIRKDIDECIDASQDFNEFIEQMKARNYRINHLDHGKYITIKLPDMKKARRLKGKSLGDEKYSEEGIRLRLAMKQGQYETPPINRSTGNFKNIPYIKKDFVKHKKWKDMNFYEREQFKIVMLQHGSLIRMSKHQQMWVKTAKQAEFNKSLENLQFISKKHFRSEDDVILFINKRKLDLAKEYKKLDYLKSLKAMARDLYSKIENHIVLAPSDLQEYQIKIGENVSLESVQKYILELNKSISIQNENCKKMKSDISHATRLLSDEAKNLINVYNNIRKESRDIDKELREYGFYEKRDKR